MYSRSFVEISHNIKVEVRPEYMETESDAPNRKHVFAYFIRIYNLGDQPVRVLKRHWEINDSAGEEYEVDGDGIVGRQPLIEPGSHHEYNSYCVLKSYKGSMTGYYLAEREDGETLKITIPTFLLRSHLLN